jgi:magnesium transporter
MIKNINFNQPITTVAHQDLLTLDLNESVGESLQRIRSEGLGERIVYFYAVDENNKLCGVIPTRRLLIAPEDALISELMISNLVTVSHHATVLEAYELLAKHKFLALPVVDNQQHVVGVIDVLMFTDENFRAVARDQVRQVFESIGFHISEIQDASAIKSFILRFRWLVPTIGSGIICALLAKCYELTLAKSIILAFFLTLVLGLGESVSVQSMTVTIYALRNRKPTVGWYLKALWRELRTAMLLGIASGATVGVIVALTHQTIMGAMVIGGSILLTICAAAFFGLSIPAFLHAIRLDPRIAAGPLTLAMADICTILIYLGIATLLL